MADCAALLDTSLLLSNLLEKHQSQSSLRGSFQRSASSLGFPSSFWGVGRGPATFSPAASSINRGAVSVERSNSFGFGRQCKRKGVRVSAQGGDGDPGGNDEAELKKMLSRPQPEARPVQEVESGERVETELKLKRQTQLGVQFGRHYEIMYLISEKEIENVPRIINFYRGCVEKNGGIVWRLNDWGVRRLAYRIKKQRRANYVLMNFECIPRLMVAIDKVMKQDPRIIRQLVMKQKRAVTKPCPPPPEYRTPEIGSLLAKDDEGNIIALQDEDEWEQFEEYEEFEEGDEFDEGEEGEFLLEDEGIDFEAESEVESEAKLKEEAERLRLGN